MPSIKLPVALTVLLVVGAALGIGWTRSTWILTADQKAGTIVAILATLGGLVSAVFVVFAYWHTSWTAVEDNRPQLLIQIVNQKATTPSTPPAGKTVTVVQYQNTTPNQFSDLSIQLKVHWGNRELELVRLFPHKMVMTGRDQRSRRFDPYEAITAAGADLRTEASKGVRVVMTPSYSYTFRRKPQEVICQDYVWNPQREEWDIA